MCGHVAPFQPSKPISVVEIGPANGAKAQQQAQQQAQPPPPPVGEPASKRGCYKAKK
jgi:hypothetical protein